MRLSFAMPLGCDDDRVAAVGLAPNRGKRRRSENTLLLPPVNFAGRWRRMDVRGSELSGVTEMGASQSLFPKNVSKEESVRSR
jgi:hypothetical protein